MSYAGGAAGGLSLFNMWSTSRQIEKNNQASVDAYNITNSTLTFAQGNNWLRAIQAADEARRVSNINIMEGKVELNQQASKIAMNEGVTAGNSKARMLQTYYLQSSQVINKQNQATESAINKLAMGVEDTNWQIQQKKMEAYNTMQQNLITGNNAALQIIGSGISGAVQGYSLGSTLDKPEVSSKIDATLSNIGTTTNTWLEGLKTSGSNFVESTGSFFDDLFSKGKADYSTGYRVTRY